MRNTITKLAGRYVNTMARIAPATAGKHGFRLFCYPARVPLRAHQKDFLNTAQQSGFTHQGKWVQVYKWGGGPKKVLFLHGWQSHSYRWKNYIEALPADAYTVYALDAPGHGMSEGNFLSLPLYSTVIEAFLEQNDGVATVVSHSIGSFSMMYTLHRKPLLPLEQLVVMGAPGEVTDFIGVYKQRLSLTDRAVGHTLQHFNKAVGKPAAYFSAASFAADIKIPGLIIHDRQDKDAPYEYALEVKAAWPAADLLTTQGLGHNLKSPAVVTAVKDFLAGKQGRQLVADFKLL